MSEKPPITTVAGQVLGDEDQTPEARRLAGAVLNQAREDQADDAETSAVEDRSGVGETDGGEPDGGTGPVGEAESEPADMASQLDTMAPERRAELETERTNLQRKHTKMLDEPGYARTLLAVQARLAEIDEELS